jgi:hypothetical protein
MSMGFHSLLPRHINEVDGQNRGDVSAYLSVSESTTLPNSQYNT